MNETLLITAFILFIGIVLLKNRKKIKIQGIFPLLYVALLKTSIGLKSMGAIAKKFPKTFNAIYTTGIVIGFAGMLLIIIELIRVTIKLFSGGGSGVVPVLPIEAKGVFYVPFLYWIISIFIIAFIHEFSHGIASRTYNIPVKSSGIAFLGLIVPIIPAAFVEPDEQKMQKQQTRKQLAVFAAGALANIITGILFLIIALAGTNAMQEIIHYEGAEITKISQDTPAQQAGLAINTIITGVNKQPIKNTEEILKILTKTVPGEEWKIQTDKGEYTMKLGTRKDNGKAYMGLDLKDKITITTRNTADKIIIWLIGLLKWLFALSTGIALFNLLPAGPLDGGRMLKLVLEKYNKPRIWKIISTATFMLVLINIASGFIK
ncbi:site-2 protease family protein [Candidatus Woesearchaeota archaeon]|nr:site-2 protease family protein [Candidatus Woesearchaeota archaeon]